MTGELDMCHGMRQPAVAIRLAHSFKRIRGISLQRRVSANDVNMHDKDRCVTNAANGTGSKSSSPDKPVFL